MKPVRPRPLTASWLLVAGPTIWAAHFLSVYGSHALLCLRASPGTHFVLVAITSGSAAVALVILLAKALTAENTGDPASFIAKSGAVSALLSLCAVLWTTLPALMLQSCIAPG